MEDIFSFADELGPAKVIHVHEPSLGLKAVLVVDNVALPLELAGSPDAGARADALLARVGLAERAGQVGAGLPVLNPG